MERRGLDCENSVPLQYDAYLKPEVIRMFKETGVLSEKELEARNEVKWEIYIKKVQIEARVLGDLSLNHIIPVAVRYQSLLLDNITKLKETFGGYPEYDDMSEEPVAWFARLPDISVPSPAWSTKWWKPAKKPTVSRICVPKRSLTTIPSLLTWMKSAAISTTWN